MNIKRILCPADFSKFNDAANQYASMMAKSNGSRIIYLHVAHEDMPYATQAHLDRENVQSVALRRLEEIKPTMEGIEATYAVEYGLPSETIVKYANENDIDMIVIGTHGRTGVPRVLMGSVAEAVIRKAECPVLAIKANTAVPHTIE